MAHDLLIRTLDEGMFDLKKPVKSTLLKAGHLVFRPKCCKMHPTASDEPVVLVGNNSTRLENASIITRMWELPLSSTGTGPLWSMWIVRCDSEWMRRLMTWQPGHCWVIVRSDRWRTLFTSVDPSGQPWSCVPQQLFKNCIRYTMFRLKSDQKGLMPFVSWLLEFLLRHVVVAQAWQCVRD